MAKGDIASTFTLPPDIDTLLDKLAAKRKVSRREIVIQAIKLLSEAKGVR